MSNTSRLIRATKQSYAVRMAVACHLEDVLKSTVDPKFLDEALARFYAEKDGLNPRTEDVDLLEVKGDGLADADHHFTWSKKSLPMMKIITLMVRSKQPTVSSERDDWTINIVIGGNNLTLIDSGCQTFDVFSLEGNLQAKDGIASAISHPLGQRRKISLPEELKPSLVKPTLRRDLEDAGYVDITSGLNTPSQVSIAHGGTPVVGGTGDVKVPYGASGDEIGSIDRTGQDLITVQGIKVGTGEPVGHHKGPAEQRRRDHPSHLASGNLGGDNSVPDVNDIVGGLTNLGVSQPVENRSSAGDVTMQSAQVTVVPAPTSAGVGPFGDAVGSFRVHEDDFNVTRDGDVTIRSSSNGEEYLETHDQGRSKVTLAPPRLKLGTVPAPQGQALTTVKTPIMARSEVPTRFYSMIEPDSLGQSQWQQQLVGRAQSTAVKNSRPAGKTFVEKTNGEGQTQSPQPVVNSEDVYRRSDVTRDTDILFNLGRQRSLQKPEGEPEELLQADVLKRARFISNQSDDWLQYEREELKQQSSMHQQLKPKQQRYQPRLTPSPEGLPSSHVEEPKVLMAKNTEPTKDLNHYIPRRRREECDGGHAGDQEAQGGSIFRHHQDRRYQEPPQISNTVHRAQDQSQAAVGDLSVADLSKLVSQMTTNTLPRTQQMRIQSSVQYPNFDPAAGDDAELAINSLSILQDLGYSVKSLIIGFCYQNGLSELLLALTPMQKSDFKLFAREFRRWYGTNPATAQAEYDRLRQKHGENELALWERINRCFRQVEGRRASNDDNYRLCQKFIDSLSNEETALLLRPKFLRDEYRSTTELVQEAISIRQSLETQKIHRDNRKMEMKALLQTAAEEMNLEPLVATTVQGQKSGGSLNGKKFCKRCHTDNHVIEECTPPQDLFRFSRYCTTHGWGSHDDKYCKQLMRLPVGAGYFKNGPSSNPTWAERHLQIPRCSKCGGPHEDSSCRANAKQITEFNKVKNGSKPNRPEVTFNVPPQYTTNNNVNSSMYMADEWQPSFLAEERTEEVGYYCYDHEESEWGWS